MYTPGPKPPFDVRDIVRGSELDNDHLQARYDTANRMILLIGDIPFDRLFTETWESLMPEINAKIGITNAMGLMRERPDLPDYSVSCCLEHLFSQHPELSWRDYVSTNYKRYDVKRDQQMDQLFDVHVALWRQGIYFPHPHGCLDCNAGQRSAMDLLATVAGSRTYRGYYERLLPGTSSDWKREEVSAVREAMKRGVLFDSGPNDRCCNTDVMECEDFAPNQNCFDCSEDDNPCIQTILPPPDPE